jgi:hypothetical protein
MKGETKDLLCVLCQSSSFLEVRLQDSGQSFRVQAVLAPDWRRIRRVGQGQNLYVCSSHHVFQSTEGYIPQAHDRIKAGKDGGYSLKKFPPRDLGHTTASWEAMGITTGRLPTTMTVDPDTGNDTVPIMTMNSVLIDEYSSKYQNRMKNITLFPSQVMLNTLAVIEELLTEFWMIMIKHSVKSKVLSMFWI